jgi:hypothetical protein
MTREKLRETVQEAAKGNRLSCEKAHEMTQTLHVSLQEIGSICNELNIKITACQLGCF